MFKQGADEEKAEVARLSSFVGAMAIGDLVKSTLGPKVRANHWHISHLFCQLLKQLNGIKWQSHREWTRSYGAWATAVAQLK